MDTENNMTSPDFFPEEIEDTMDECLSAENTVIDDEEDTGLFDAEIMDRLQEPVELPDQCKADDIIRQTEILDKRITEISNELGCLSEIKQMLTDNSICKSDTAALSSKMSQLEKCISDIAAKQDRNDRQLSQTLRENAAFQVQVRQGMQKDIDSYKEQLSSGRFDPILKEIATVYVEYQGLLDDGSMSERSRKNISAMFEQLGDILTDYGAEIRNSEPGRLRQTRVTKVIGKIPTGDSEKHNTVAVSRKPGVIKDRVVLYPEFVDIYVYDPNENAEEEKQ